MVARDQLMAVDRERSQTTKDSDDDERRHGQREVRDGVEEAIRWELKTVENWPQEPSATKIWSLAVARTRTRQGGARGCISVHIADDTRTDAFSEDVHE
jgi:hypothetical protein